MEKEIILTIEDAATGNIYCDAFMADGHRFFDYAADCALCGHEINLTGEMNDKRQRSKTVLKAKGWQLIKEKWVCLQCCQANNL